MKIKSTFKDYYDFVADQYGGGDPRIVYERGSLVPRDKQFNSVYTDKVVEMPNFPLEDPMRLGQSYDMSLRYLVVTGKAYLISCLYEYAVDLNSYCLQPVEELLKKNKKWRFIYRRDFGIEFGKEYPFLVELSRLVGAPVFVIRTISWHGKWDKAKIAICGQCPILAKIGFPAIIPPQQMYQDLAYFVGNTMKPVPDNEPPVAVSNREKILKAGFDLKQSFRHRV
jgi:hypothetical protein